MSDREHSKLSQSATDDCDDSPPSPPTSPPAESQAAPPSSPTGSGEAGPQAPVQQQANATTPVGSGPSIWTWPRSITYLPLPPVSGASGLQTATPPPTLADLEVPDLEGEPIFTEPRIGALRPRRTMMPPLYMLCESLIVDTLAVYCVVPNCGLMFASRGEHDEHLKNVHRTGRFRCHGCTNSYDRKQDLGAHVRTQHGSLIGNWRCPECGKIYRTHNKLQTHVYRYHCKGMFKCFHPGCAFGPATYRDDVYKHYYAEHNTQARRQDVLAGNVEFD